MAGNQYQVDPRQAEFLKNYLDPNSPTYSNALQSGLAAGYAQEYAENILSLMPDWLSESIEDANLVSKAMRNLNDLLDEKEDKRIRLDTTKFVAERLHKSKFSQRVENTGKDGGAIEVTTKEEDKEAIEQFHKTLIKNRELRALEEAKQLGELEQDEHSRMVDRKPDQE